MILRYILPIIAIAGIALGVSVVVKGNKTPVVADPIEQPARAPFDSYVAGAGIIEASSENIAIGTPIGNIVTDVFVKVGDRVMKGEPLFKLRDQVTSATLAVRQAAAASAESKVQAAKTLVEAARAKLERLQSLPRPEDVPPAEARVAAAKTILDDAKNQLDLWESVNDKRAVSQEELDRRRFAVRTMESRLAEMQAELAQLKAGAWAADIAVARADVATAAAQVESALSDAAAAAAQVNEAQAELDRHTIRAPVDATVLQVKIRPGEYAQPGPLATPLMLLGNLDVLYVRVDVDENDAWRVHADAPAAAVMRGNTSLKTELKFVRIEPYVVPKRSLTGDSSERVDTRVLQVLYSFAPDTIPAKVGQQLDVFIKAPALSFKSNTH